MDACQILRAAQQLNYVYEGEPPQVNEYCLRFFPPWQFTKEELVRLPIPPLELGPEPVSFPIELKELRDRLVKVAESKNDTLFLDLDDIEAQTQPGVVWQVYVGPQAGAEPDPKSPSYVGVISLFGTGVRDEPHHGFRPAHFIFPLNRAIQAALKGKEERVMVTFVPSGILIDGKRTRPEVKSKVRIGKASLVVERAKANEKKEKEQE